jgi:serine/threonine protein kinase
MGVECKEELLPPKINMKDNRLGVGGFGSVFEVQLGDQSKAVKFVSFEKFMLSLVPGITEKDKSVTEKCLREVIDSCSYKLLLKPKNVENKSIELKEENIDKNKLSEIFRDNQESECEGVNLDDLERVFSAVMNTFLTDLRTETATLADLSKYSNENDAVESRAFVKYDYCLVDRNFNVYLVMEKLDSNLNELRKAVKTFVGPRNVNERILFSIQILYKLWKMHSLGYAHCDIKPSNILFKPKSDYKIVYFGDFGISRRYSPCEGGTKTYMSPELLFAIQGSKHPKLTIFNTSVNYQSDAFAVGMVLLTNEVLHEDSMSYGEEYLKIKDSIDYQSAMSDKGLYYKAINDLLNKRQYLYEETKEGENLIDRRLDHLYGLAILNLLELDYSKRWPASVALHFFYKLFMNQKFENVSYDDLMNMLKDDKAEAIIKELKNSENSKPVLNKESMIPTSPNWESYQAFTNTIEGVEELLGMRTKARGVEKEIKKSPSRILIV